MTTTSIRQKKFGDHAGQVVPVDKTWLSQEEAMGYLGMSARWIRETLPAVGVRVAQLSKRVMFFNLADINQMLEDNVCNTQQLIAARRERSRR